MRRIAGDARRYAWCRSQVFWVAGSVVDHWIEDMEGAADDGQVGLAHYSARQLGEACATALVLALHDEKPVPAPHLRGAWALERLAGHELYDDCWALVRGDPEATPEELVERSRRLVMAVREVAGELPQFLTPEGYFPAMSLARDWLTLLGEVGEEGFLPREWTRS